MGGVNFESWPFNKDEKVLLYWISSPWTDSNGRGMRYVKAYFKRADNSFEEVIYPWGNMPLLLIGFYYQNRRILERNPMLLEYRFSNESINEQHIHNAKDIIPLKIYSLSGAKIAFEEKCISLKVGNTTYIIPCMEMIRAIYGMTSFFMESLLSTDSLSSFAKFSLSDENTLNVDFFSDFPFELFEKKSFLSAFVYLTQTKKICDWRDTIYSQNGLSEKMIAPYPKLEGVSIVGYGLECYNKVLLLNINLLGLKQPYKNVKFTHPAYIDPQNPVKKSRTHYIKGESDVSEDIILADDEAADKNKRAKTISIDDISLQFPQISVIKKIKAVGDKHETKSVFIDKSREDFYSTGPRLGNAEATPIEMELLGSEEIAILEPGFEEFGRVLKKISKSQRISNFACEIFELPNLIPIPNMPDGSKRKYALVKFDFHREEVCIIEICGVGFAISTLVVCGTNAEKEANIVLRSLEKTNGHWHKDDISRSAKAKGIRISTLRHFDGRSANQWAALIISLIVKR